MARRAYRQRVGHDVNYLAMTGILSAHEMVGGHHALPASQIADLSGAMSAAMGVCAALFARTSTGKGRVLDISLTESAMAMWAPMLSGFMANGKTPTPGGELLTGGSSLYGTYECRDGQFIALGVIEPKFQSALKALVGDLSRENLEETFRTKPRDYWVSVLTDACVSPVLSVNEVPHHPHHVARKIIDSGFVQPPIGRNDGHPSQLGEDGKDILLECGFSLRNSHTSGGRCIVGKTLRKHHFHAKDRAACFHEL